MMFQPDAITMNIATVVAMRNHSLSVSSGSPACWAASVEVSGARTTKARASAAMAKTDRRNQFDRRRSRAVTPAGRGVPADGR